jgi:hypothetical protein
LRIADNTEKDERMRLLSQELQRSQYERGTASFEHVLNQFQLSGKVDPRIKQTIWEMLNVRNVIIHRGSVADRRLVEGCPWMELKIGQPVVLTDSMLGSYADALSWYVRCLIEQLSERYRDASLQDRLSPTSEEQGSLDSRTELQAAQIRLNSMNGS